MDNLHKTRKVQKLGFTLAEVFSVHPKDVRKHAFTLAEVLITLGIIGVVAAMTLPTLIAKHQKRVLVEQLKTGMSILSQGFQKAMADDGVDDLRNTELFKICDANLPNWRTDEFANSCNPMMQKYFKGIKYESVMAMQALGDTTNWTTDPEKCKQLVGKTNKWWMLHSQGKLCRGWKNMSYTLTNGMRLDVGLDDLGHFLGYITLDVNGSKGPNTWGRDAFYLKILSNGTVVPRLGYMYCEALKKHLNRPDVDCTVQVNVWIEDGCANNSNNSQMDGVDCAARIERDGWVMNY